MSKSTIVNEGTTGRELLALKSAGAPVDQIVKEVGRFLGQEVRLQEGDGDALDHAVVALRRFAAEGALSLEKAIEFVLSAAKRNEPPAPVAEMTEKAGSSYDGEGRSLDAGERAAVEAAGLDPDAMVQREARRAASGGRS